MLAACFPGAIGFASNDLLGLTPPKDSSDSFADTQCFLPSSGACSPAPCHTEPTSWLAQFNARPDPQARLLETPCTVGIYGLIQSPSSKKGEPIAFPEHISPQPGRPFSFAFGPKAMGEFLVYGKNGGRLIAQRAALGGDADKTYRLIVFKSEGLPWHAAGTLANLEPVLTEIYGDALPDIADAVNDITKKTFKEVTGCNATILAKYYNAAKAGCRQTFRDLVAGPLKFGAECDKPPMTVGGYTTKCPAEQFLLGYTERKAKVPALELRAFLANFLSFNPLWTGYGYTANDYGRPLEQEYWVPNMKATKLPHVQFATLKVKAAGGPPVMVAPFDATSPLAIF